MAIQIANTSDNVIAVIKATVCVKAYMLHLPNELIAKGYKPSVYQMMKK